MWRLIKSNLKQGRLCLAVVVVFIILSTVFMSIGLTLVSKLDSVVDDKVSATNSADIKIRFAFETPRMNFDRLFPFIFSEINGVKEYAVTESLWTDNEKINIEEDFSDLGQGNLSVMERRQSGTPFDIVLNEELGQNEHSDKYKVYMRAKKDSGYVGREITYIIDGKRYEAVVAGTFEDVTDMYNTRIVAEESFYDIISDEWIKQEGITCYSTVLCNLIDGSDAGANEFMTRVFKQMRVFGAIESWLSDGAIQNTSISCNGIIHVRTNIETMYMIVSIIFILFSLILAIISLIVIRYMLITLFEENIRNIGVLKACGYTSADLRRAYIFQYGIVMLFSVIIGAIIAIFAIAPIVNIISGAVYLDIVVPMNAGILIGSIALITLLVLFTVFMLSKRAANLTPVSALRRGERAHSFKVNRFRLDKSKCGANTALALKSIANNKSQSVMIAVVVFITTFLCVFVSVLQYNLVSDYTAIFDVLGEERADCFMYIEDDERLEQIRGMEEVDLLLRGGNSDSINIGGITTSSFFFEDYDKKVSRNVFKGDFPKNENEVALSYPIAQALGKEIGDFVVIESLGGKTIGEFLITGFTQSTGRIFEASFTMSAMEDMFGYDYRGYYIYFKEGVDFKSITDEWKKDPTLSPVRTLNDIYNGYFPPLTNACSAIMGIIMGVTVAVVFMVVFLIVRLKLLREKRNIAIFKGVGFTTKDIVIQIVVSLMLVSAVSSLLGMVLALGVTSPIVALALSGYGVYSLTLSVNMGYAIGMLLFVNALTLLFSLTVSLSTGRISPRELIVE